MGHPDRLAWLHQWPQQLHLRGLGLPHQEQRHVRLGQLLHPLPQRPGLGHRRVLVYRLRLHHEGSQDLEDLRQHLPGQLHREHLCLQHLHPEGHLQHHCHRQAGCLQSEDLHHVHLSLEAQSQHRSHRRAGHLQHKRRHLSVEQRHRQAGHPLHRRQQELRSHRPCQFQEQRLQLQLVTLDRWTPLEVS